MYRQTAMINDFKHLASINSGPAAPNHTHSGVMNAEPVFEDNDFVISLRSGKMYDMRSHLNVEEGFLDRMCRCIISRKTGHSIELFQAGQSEMLKEKILEFLRED